MHNVYFVQCDAPVSFMTLCPIQSEGGYRGIFREEGEDTGIYFRGNHESRVSKSRKCEKMYFPHTQTSWEKYMFNGTPNTHFKIGLSLSGCAEIYT